MKSNPRIFQVILWLLQWGSGCPLNIGQGKKNIWSGPVNEREYLSRRGGGIKLVEH